MRELDEAEASFVLLSKRRCRDEKLNEILLALVPDPPRPRNADRNPSVMKAWRTKVDAAVAARARIKELTTSGKGQDTEGSKGTFWVALNAMLEYVDHHQKVDQPRIAYAFLGDGMGPKMRAFRLIRDEAARAA